MSLNTLNVALLHFFFNFMVHLNGPVRPRWNGYMWWVKGLTQLGLLSFCPHVWRHTFWCNASVGVQQAASVACVLRAPGNDRTLRALWRAEQQRAAAPKKLA